MTTEAIELFYSYAHEDEELRNQLDKHLRLLQRQEFLSAWYDRDIRAGGDWSSEIDAHLESAQIILLLISADFLASDYCYGVEMQRALERHQAGDARIIPIILRPVDWRPDTSLSRLQALPANGKPVITWPLPPLYDAAFEDIAKGIRKVVEELRTVPGQTSSHPAQTWNVPMRRNPFFTGREQLLKDLHDRLTTTKAAALTQPQAITGLGGIGKTQTAVEYAYHYREEYRYVFWVRAANRDTLIGDLVTIAELLKLPEQHESDQQKVVVALNRWLSQHAGWLLILDNADDLELVRDVIPPLNSGYILLTTRAHTIGSLAQRVEVREMDLQEGTRLLLRRAGILAEEKVLEQVPAGERAQAEAIVKEMAGLPLALEQAGAYLEETGSGLSGYLTLYRQHRTDLLKHKGKFSPEYPHTVATTWSLAFGQVEQANPAAADLLRLCAFLDPDAIPESLIVVGASALGAKLKPVAANPIKLNEAIQALLSYSLVRRNAATQTLSIHRLVQAVLKDGMESKTRRQWAERSVRAVEAAFPKVEFETWPRCREYLPHALACAELIEQHHFVFEEAADLLYRMEWYLYEHARYAEAEALLQRSLRISEQVLGPEHPYTAATLSALATLYHNQGKYAEAEPLYQRALRISEQAEGPKHRDTARILHELARLYHNQGKYAEAEPLYQHALRIKEQSLVPEHPSTLMTLESYAYLLRQMQRTQEAKKLEARVKAIRAKSDSS